MLALFCGTAALPHILIRYYTVKDEASARKSTIVGIASIGFFYVLTLYLGLGAMTSGSQDVTNNNMAAPLLAKMRGDDGAPVSLRAGILLVQLMLENRRRAEALGTATALVEAYPDRISAYYALASVHEDAGDRAQVEAVCQSLHAYCLRRVGLEGLPS